MKTHYVRKVTAADQSLLRWARLDLNFLWQLMLEAATLKITKRYYYIFVTTKPFTGYA